MNILSGPIALSFEQAAFSRSSFLGATTIRGLRNSRWTFKKKIEGKIGEILRTFWWSPFFAELRIFMRFRDLFPALSCWIAKCDEFLWTFVMIPRCKLRILVRVFASVLIIPRARLRISMDFCGRFNDPPCWNAKFDCAFVDVFLIPRAELLILMSFCERFGYPSSKNWLKRSDWVEHQILFVPCLVKKKKYYRALALELCCVQKLSITSKYRIRLMGWDRSGRLVLNFRCVGMWKYVKVSIDRALVCTVCNW